MKYLFNFQDTVIQLSRPYLDILIPVLLLKNMASSASTCGFYPDPFLLFS